MTNKASVSRSIMRDAIDRKVSPLRKGKLAKRSALPEPRPLIFQPPFIPLAGNLLYDRIVHVRRE